MFGLRTYPTFRILRVAANLRILAFLNRYVTIMSVILFEDLSVRNLAPATTARPAYAISCGGYCLADLIQQLAEPLKQPTYGVVRPYLSSVQENYYSSLASLPQHTAIERPLLVNARIVPSVDSINQLAAFAESQSVGAVWHGDALVAARVDGSLPTTDLAHASLDNTIAQLKSSALPTWKLRAGLLEYPHQIIAQHLAIFRDNLNYRIARGNYREIANGVFVADGAVVAESVVTNTDLGPIVVEADSIIAPFTSVTGPFLLERGSRIAPQSTIKHSVAIGPTAKIGGEVQASIFEQYANKQHYGYLGHSYIGSWVNLGAGTSNSNLKNTYGNVKIRLGDQAIDTGMTFFGCVVGDYTKAAINTSIFTGKLIGVASMLYGYVTENVGSFVNYARHLGDVTAADLESAIVTQSRVFGRRKLVAQDFDQQLLRDIFAQTVAQRDGLVNRPPRFSVRPPEDISRSASLGPSSLSSSPDVEALPRKTLE